MAKPVDLDITQAVAKMQQLIALADQWTAKLQAAASAMNTGAAAFSNGNGASAPAVGSSVGSHAGAPQDVAAQYSPGAPTLNPMGQKVGASVPASGGFMASPGSSPASDVTTGSGAPDPASSSPVSPAVTQFKQFQGGAYANFLKNGLPSQQGVSSSPSITSPMSVDDELKYRALREEQNNLTATRGAFGLAAVYGITQVANAYTQATVSGQPNPQGFASAWGGLIGGVLGAGIGSAFGNPLIGAGVGTALGSAGGGALMAPFTARMEAAQTLGGFAVASGQSANVLSSNAQAVGEVQNQAFDALRYAEHGTGMGPGQGGNEYALRRLGLYTGTDQTSTQNIAKIQAALRGAALETGGVNTSGIESFFTGLGILGPGAAETAAKALGAQAASGDNLYSLASRVGVVPVATLLRSEGRGNEVNALVTNFAAAQFAAYKTQGAAYESQGAADDYATSAFSGRSTAGRTGAYDKYVDSIRKQISDVDVELIDIRRAGGGDSNEFKAKSALKEGLLRQIASEENQRSQGIIGDIGATSRANLAGDAAATTRAGLYGTSADIRAGGAATLADLSSEQAQLRNSLNLPGLDFQSKAAIRARIADIDRTSVQIQASTRDATIGRFETEASTQEGANAFALSRSNRLGTGADLRRDSGRLIGSLTDESNKIQSELDAGGLTFEQTQRLKQRRTQIASQVFETQQDTLDAGYRKDDIQGYDLQAVRLRGERERLNVLPFSPGNVFANSIRTIQLDRQQIGVLNQREEALRSSGNLSPERQLQIESERQRLQTESAYGVAQLSEGIENRLPAFSAGRPRTFGLYDNEQLAAAQLFRVGSPARSFGAVNGRQVQEQNNFLHILGADFPIGPTSRTQGLNNGAGGGGGDMSAVVQLLTRIAAAIEAPGGRIGSSMRTGEEAGQALGHLTQRNPGTGYNGKQN